MKTATTADFSADLISMMDVDAIEQMAADLSRAKMAMRTACRSITNLQDAALDAGRDTIATTLLGHLHALASIWADLEQIEKTAE